MANAIAWADEGDQEFESLSLQRRVSDELRSEM